MTTQISNFIHKSSLNRNEFTLILALQTPGPALSMIAIPVKEDMVVILSLWLCMKTKSMVNSHSALKVKVTVNWAIQSKCIGMTVMN